MNIESAEQIRPEKKELSAEDIERINAAKKQLQELIDRATNAGGPYSTQYLEKIAKESNDIDESGRNSADRIVAYIEELCEKVKLPGDIRKENAKKVMEEIKELEEKIARKQTAKTHGQEQKGKKRRRGSFLRLQR